MNNIKIIFYIFLFMPAILLSSDNLNNGDTAWMLIATALVMLMTPAGLALFYGGLTRSKNILNTISMSIIAFVIGTLAWIIFGYSIAFGEGDLFGTGKIALNGVTDKSLVGTIPEFLFIAFQGTFAAIAIALASGSMIERVKFSTYMIFVALWVIFVYSPIAHWAWGGGETLNFHELDFAGGTVVHLNAGVAGFVVAMMIGKRKDYGKRVLKPYSPILTILGAVLLWFGWFGFNAGSSLGANELASSAFIVTNIAAAAGVLGWLIIEYITYKKFTLVGIASGIIAGLVAITPASGTVGICGAITIGLVGGAIGFIGVAKLKNIFKVDDSLDVFWIHGLVAIWGSIATAIFIAPYLMPENYNMANQLISQIKAILLTIVYSGVVTAILFYISSKLTNGGRVDQRTENIGLDEVLHGEKAMNL